jgi:hypothetical protein
MSLFNREEMVVIAIQGTQWKIAMRKDDIFYLYANSTPTAEDFEALKGFKMLHLILDDDCATVSII